MSFVFWLGLFGSAAVGGDAVVVAVPGVPAGFPGTVVADVADDGVGEPGSVGVVGVTAGVGGGVGVGVGGSVGVVVVGGEPVVVG